MPRVKRAEVDPLTKPCDIWPHAARSATGQALHVWRVLNVRKTMLMSRIIWEICTGKPVGKDKVIIMACGEPLCVFYGHMKCVSRKVIAAKRKVRKTLPDCPASVAKLPVDVRIILTMCVANNIGTNAKLARRFGITPYHVRVIRNYVVAEQAANALMDAQMAERKKQAQKAPPATPCPTQATADINPETPPAAMLRAAESASHPIDAANPRPDSPKNR